MALNPSTKSLYAFLDHLPAMRFGIVMIEEYIFVAYHNWFLLLQSMLYTLQIAARADLQAGLLVAAHIDPHDDISSRHEHSLAWVHRRSWAVRDTNLG